MSKTFQEDVELSAGEAVETLRRAIRFVRPFRSQFRVKLALLGITLIPLVLLPWPVKVVIDHVIDEVPVSESIAAYPAFVRPLMQPLLESSTSEILLAAIGFQIFLFLLVGAYGTGGSQRDSAEAYLAGGHDTATRTENEANAGFSLAGGFIGIFDFRYTLRLTQALNHHYRAKLFERIQSLPMPAFDDERIGDAVYRVMYDTPAITNAVYRFLLTPFGATLNIVLTVAVMAAVFGHRPELLYTALAFLPLSLVATLPFAGALRRRSVASRQAGATTTATAEEGMANILAVQSLGGEGRQRERFDEDSWNSFGRYRSVFRAGAAAFLAAAIPGIALMSYAFLHVTELVIAGELTRGDFSLIFTYFISICVSAISLGRLWFDVQGNTAGLRRVFFLMDMEGESDGAGTRAIPPLRDRITIESASYRYPDGTPGIEAASLEIRRGQLVALAGPAGAGKTTLAYLIPRYLTPQEGSVRFDGRDICEFTLESVRAEVAFVFQETLLFEGTIAENLRVGNPSAGETELRRAAKSAGADEFIARLPEGYATQLGRGGGKLSVGQRQRLSIARALVRDCPVLILDEPTSALDPRTEGELVASLREVARDRAVIVIAHRLSTIRAADEIIFLEEGRILERGSHAELMQRPDSHYRRFTEIQTRPAA